MKLKSTFSSILTAFAIFAQSGHGAALLIDFDNSAPAAPGNTQSGWEAFSETADANNKSVVYSGYTDLSLGDITVTTAGVTNTRNYNNGSSVAPDFPGTDLDRVYNDLILNNQAGGIITITVAGLEAGTFNFRTHHLTQGGELSGKSTFDFAVQDADSPAFGQSVGTFEMGRGDGATYWAATVLDFAVTSNGSDPVLLRITTNTLTAGGGQGAWVGINGLEIVPEPSSILLGGFGLLVLLRRRR